MINFDVYRFYILIFEEQSHKNQIINETKKKKSTNFEIVFFGRGEGGLIIMTTIN